MRVNGCENCYYLEVFKEMHGFNYGPAEIITECGNKDLEANEWYVNKADGLGFEWSNDEDRCPGFELKL